MTLSWVLLKGGLDWEKEWKMQWKIELKNGMENGTENGKVVSNLYKFNDFNGKLDTDNGRLSAL